MHPCFEWGFLNALKRLRERPQNAPLLRDGPKKDKAFRETTLPALVTRAVTCTPMLCSGVLLNANQSRWSLSQLERLGRFSPNNRKPRPVLIGFASIEDKHKFLQLSKQLRQSGLRLDDWLTERQQEERDTLSADFQALKGKGYKPFFRGSVLMYRHNDKPCVCKKDKADTVPLAA